MKRKTYTITGTNDVGYRVTVPKIMGLVSGDKLVCEIVNSETLTYRVQKKVGSRSTGLAKCHNCGDTLIAPDDGYPYWCVKCSQEDEEEYQQRRGV